MKITLDIKDPKISGFIYDGKEIIENAEQIVFIVANKDGIKVGSNYCDLETFNKILEALKEWGGNNFNLFTTLIEKKDRKLLE